MQDIEYAKTLSHYLAHSNENEIDGIEIARLIIKYFFCEEKLKWLDVGCGPGGKLGIIAECLGHWGGPSIELCGLDPSSYWLDCFTRQLKRGIYGLEIKETILDTWENYSATEYGQKYNVISFLHSVYGLKTEKDKIPSLERVIDLASENGLIIDLSQN